MGGMKIEAWGIRGYLACRKLPVNRMERFGQIPVLTTRSMRRRLAPECLATVPTLALRVHQHHIVSWTSESTGTGPL